MQKRKSLIGKYLITEKWYVSGRLDNVEKISRHTVKEVRAYIKDFIESWKENAEESGKKVSYIRTDGRTFAQIRVLSSVFYVGSSQVKQYDTFSLKVSKQK